MPRKTARQTTPEFTEIKGFDSESEIDRGIEKLTRCQTLLQELWDCRAAYDDPRTQTLVDRIRTTILEIFGPNSPEYGRHRYHEIWHGDQFVNMAEQEIQAGFRAGFPHTGVMLKNLIDRLEESRADLHRDTGARTRSTFEGLDLHPRISTVCVDLYRDGHYRQAVLDASIALVNYVKEKSRKHDLDGAALMSTVFSSNNPVLAFNGLADQAGRSDGQGRAARHDASVHGRRPGAQESAGTFRLRRFS
ncbi:MAG: TIGR02391 family protein [Candidatus Binataceae bacterium]|jgi:uncharacterized protein (TIGR02391 family)